MKTNSTILAIAVVLVGALTVPTISLGQSKGKAKPPAKPAKLTFNKDIGPAMKKACAGCHTGAAAKKGLDLSTYAGVMKGGKDGKVIVAGHPDKSMLIGMLHGKPKLMPPGKALDAKTIGAVETWVKQGAKEK